MFGGRLRAPASSCVSHRGRRREKCPPDPAANQLCPPRSAKVELGGLGCGIRIFARKGRVRKDTAQDAGFGLGHGVRVPLPILPRPHPKSQHPGITHRAGRPAPGGSPPYPAPPHPQSRETGKPGVEYQLEFEEKSGQRHPLLPHYSSLMDDYFFYFPKAFPHSSFTVSPQQTKRVRWATKFKPPQNNTSFRSLYPADPAGSRQKPYPPLHSVFCGKEKTGDLPSSLLALPASLGCGEGSLWWTLERL